MSLGGILSSAVSALNAAQTGIQTSSQNIANAEVTGYTREQVDLVTAGPEQTPWGSIGTGVAVHDISRIRDTLLDTQYRAASTAASSADTTKTAYGQIESIFGEPSTTGLASSLDSFWNSWSQLASDPTNTASQSVVQEQGIEVSQTLNSFANQLDALGTNSRNAVGQDVTTVNNLLQQIASYNAKIIPAQSGNKSPANDLLDARDDALDQLSSLVNYQSTLRPDGTVAVFIGGNTMVDGSDARQLTMTNSQVATVSVVGSSTPLTAVGGQIGANLDVINTQVPQVEDQLNSLTSALVTQVNAIHSTGVTWSGTPPTSTPAGNFFAQTNPPPSAGDPDLTAAGIHLDPTVAANAGAIAASGASATGPGDTSVATAISNLQTSPVNFTNASGASLGSASIDQFFQQLIGTVATQSQTAQDNSTVNDTLQQNAQTQRQSVSGVSTDEELVALIQHQSAYTAAARVVNVVDQMTQTLVALGTGAT